MNGTFLPDFQGGLAVLNNGSGTITKLDGITGQPYPSYTAASPQILTGQMVAGTDGSIYAVEFNPGNVGQGGAGLQTSLVGINPLTGAQLFSIPLEPQPAFQEGYFPPGGAALGGYYIRAQLSNLIVAGDGYAYLAFDYPEIVLNSALSDSPDTRTEHVMLLRVNSAGEFDKIPITNVPGLGPEGMLPDGSVFAGTLITNPDTGVLLSWRLNWYAGWAYVRSPATGMAVTNGTSVTLVNQPQVPTGQCLYWCEPRPAGPGRIICRHVRQLHQQRHGRLLARQRMPGGKDHHQFSHRTSSTARRVSSSGALRIPMSRELISASAQTLFHLDQVARLARSARHSPRPSSSICRSDF